MVRRPARVALLLVLLSAPGCASNDDEEAAASDAAAVTASSDGSWTAPAFYWFWGNMTASEVTPDPPWDPRLCSKRFTEGASVLREYLLERERSGEFPGIRKIEGYNCRQSTGPMRRMSVHGTGRALDVHFAVGDTENGDRVANWLVKNAANLGVQFVIWNRTAWRPKGSVDADGNKNEGGTPYTGDSPHTDHIHMELNEEGANKLRPFFRGK